MTCHKLQSLITESNLGSIMNSYTLVSLLGIVFYVSGRSTNCDGGICTGRGHRTVESHFSHDRGPAITSVGPVSSAAATVNPDFCGIRRAAKPTKQRIVGGKEAYRGQFPWQAMILMSVNGIHEPKEFQCGGTLINENVIITAAHCIKYTSLER